MSLLESFYKKLMNYSFFRKKAISRLVSAIEQMDKASGNLSPGKKDWLTHAASAKAQRLKLGIFKANLLNANDILAGCEFYLILELNTDNRFVCTRVFRIDDIEKVNKWDGVYSVKGDYLRLDANFYFRDCKVVDRSRNGFKLKLAPGSGNVIFFKRMNKREIEDYNSGHGVASSGV